MSQQLAEGDEWLTPQELADWLKVPVRTVYDWRSRGVGPTGYKVGRHVRYLKTDVTQFITGVDVTRPIIARRRAPKR